jgi:hypothetical protein
MDVQYNKDGPENKPQITPAMIDAGLKALIATLGGDRYQGDDRRAVEAIFRAMTAESHREIQGL